MNAFSGTESANRMQTISVNTRTHSCYKTSSPENEMDNKMRLRQLVYRVRNARRIFLFGLKPNTVEYRCLYRRELSITI